MLLRRLASLIAPPLCVACGAAAGARTGLPVVDCLERTGQAVTQVGRGRVERLASIAGRIWLRALVDVPDEILLVDDVITTGATLAACAAACDGRSVRGVAYA